MKWSQLLASNTGLNAIQSFARLFFAILTLLYFVNNDTNANFDMATGWGLLAGYVVLQLLLQIKFSARLHILSYLVDVISVSALVIIDPLSTPPTLTLFLLVSLSAGILFGLHSFIYTLLASLVAGGFAVWQHAQQLNIAPTQSSLFLVATLGLCSAYFLLMMLRNRTLAISSAKAAWRNQETGLISQRALVSTAGWLIPLHDRIGMPLSVALLAPNTGVNSAIVASLVTSRIRHSDIIGHFDDGLALLLPDTNAGGMDSLLKELHHRQPIFHASVMTLTNSTLALDPMLYHLKKELARAADHGKRWLVHASTQL